MFPKHQTDIVYLVLFLRKMKSETDLQMIGKSSDEGQDCGSPHKKNHKRQVEMVGSLFSKNHLN